MNLSPPAFDSLKAQQMMGSYLDLLYTAQPHRNLTRVPREQAWARHIEESLSLLPHHEWRDGELVLDFGSGGGVPGIPLAITLPTVRFLLLERDLAKAAFLRQCVEAIGLDAVEVLARDARELGREQGHPRAHLIVSRAAAPPPRLLPQLPPLLAEGGRGLLIVGQTVVLDQPLRELCRREGLLDPEIIETNCTRILRVRRR
ncbi:MAG: 16S rRNA (guanine(527)-N(7))-methyltransferase RsmG [Candidatus Dormibacteria bacterium]